MYAPGFHHAFNQSMTTLSPTAFVLSLIVKVNQWCATGTGAMINGQKSWVCWRWAVTADWEHNHNDFTQQIPTGEPHYQEADFSRADIQRLREHNAEMGKGDEKWVQHRVVWVSWVSFYKYYPNPSGNRCWYITPSISLHTGGHCRWTWWNSSCCSIPADTRKSAVLRKCS